MPDQRFVLSATPLSGLVLVKRVRMEDERGFLTRIYCREELAAAGFIDPIVQINQTMTRARGAVRGMHFQNAPHVEDKFVSCIRGEVLDVAVDLRAESPTFLQWHAVRLSPENGQSLFIPKGFGHGFQALTADCELLYLHTASYSRESEGGLNPLDPQLAIKWPLPVTELSSRDRAHPLLDVEFTGLHI